MSTQNSSELDRLMENIRQELGAGDAGGQERQSPVTGRPGLAEIMRRVRAEIARRRGHVAIDEAGHGQGEESMFPRWQAVAGAFVPKADYALGDLLKYSDRDFILAAYRAVLRRSPDENGLRHYLSRLRDGHTTKVEVLGDLRWSAEGQARGVHIDGLLIPYTVWKWKRKRYIGPIIRWMHAFTRLGGLLDRQSAQMARQIYDVHELGRIVNELAGAVEQWQLAMQQQVDERPTRGALKTLAQRLDANVELTTRFSEQMGQLSQVEARLDDLEGRAKGYANGLELRALATAIGGLQSRLEEISKDHASDKASVIRLERESTHVERRIQHIERAWATRAGGAATEPGVHSWNNGQLPTEPNAGLRAESKDRPDHATDAPRLDLAPFYAAFEDRFRGDRNLVRKRAEPYLDWIKQVGAGTAIAPVLDIGCGRGEWLELLRDHGLLARGIDLNRIFADVCRGYGLDIIEGDAISVLSAMPAASIGAITSMHLVEHLSFEDMIILLDEANRVLVPGGLIALETPNPENLLVGSHTFYMDPTHRNPIPPEALRWIVEARGFYGAKIERLTVARELSAPALLPQDLPGASSINVLLSSLHAAPDYAIVARKS